MLRFFKITENWQRWFISCQLRADLKILQQVFTAGLNLIHSQLFDVI